MTHACSEYKRGQRTDKKKKSKNRNKDELKQETVYKHELYTVSCVSIR